MELLTKYIRNMYYQQVLADITAQLWATSDVGV